MGYNDNSGDFFIDTTLTDHGRQLLARNDGSFNISRFRLGDDDIDYRNWNELTGSENKDSKILDAPIFEAFVNESIGLRSSLVTIKNATLQYMPIMVSNPPTAALKDRTDTTGGGINLTISQQTNQQSIIPAELVDFVYIIQLDNDLLYIANEIPTSIQPFGNARYILPAADGRTTSVNGTQCIFTLRVQNLNTNIFNILAGATALRPRTINTTVTITGQQSGLSVNVPVSILEYYV